MEEPFAIEPKSQADYVRETYRRVIAIEVQVKATNGRVTRLERASLVLGGTLVGLLAQDLLPLILPLIASIR